MKPLAAILAALFLTAASASAQTTSLKVALVDLQKCFNDYYKTEEAKTRINEQGSGYQKEFNDRMEDYKKLVDQINSLREGAKDASASEAARKEREDKLKEKIQEAQTRERELNEFRGTSSKLLQDLQVRQRKSIVDEINKVVETFAKGKYNIVIDKSGMTLNGTSGLVYTEGLTDITDEIVKQLNKDKPAGSAKPAAK
ncbi:MAG: OmpH family outer membrane protein [Candidatus Methylacidiphilales bacterium]|nr:OmpH family outer membrane protein [Candidatus Methylacidiphilales bacterium]